MIQWLQTRPLRDRVAAWVLAVGIPAGVLVALSLLTTAPLVRTEETRIATVALPIPPEPPPPEAVPPPPPPAVTQPAPRPLAQPEEEGRASPPNLRSRASPVVAPTPVVVRQPTFAAAPVPADGADSSSGASDLVGPGTGAGGEGDGFGSGRGGNGTGGGGGGTVPAVEAVKIAGRIKGGERPRGVDESQPRRVVGVNFIVQPTGRVTGCTVAESSGDATLDRFTCQKIEQRWRYRPARDRFGKAVRDEQGWFQVYTFDGSEPVLPGR